LAIAHEGQWKGMSLTENLREIKKKQMHLLNPSICMCQITRRSTSIAYTSTKPSKKHPYSGSPL
jgi:hypothetical protein